MELEFTFGEFLAMLRFKNGITQSALAKKIGTSQNYLSRIEADEKIPSRQFAERLAMGVTWDELERNLLLSKLDYPPMIFSRLETMYTELTDKGKAVMLRSLERIAQGGHPPE